MRWVKPKSKRKCDVAPEHVRKEWEHGNKNQLAELYVRENFDKVCVSLGLSRPGKEKFAERLELVISGRQKIKVTLEEGWYTEQEMKDDIGWKE